MPRVPRVGRYRIELRYVAPDLARRRLIVEGEEVHHLLLPPTGGADRWGTYVIDVAIPSPTSSVQIVTTEAEGEAGVVLLDSVSVSEAPAAR